MQFFENLMSSQKEIRDRAEKELEQLKTMPVTDSLPVFAEGMSSETENIFQLSTLIFKKVFCDNKETLSKFSPSDKEQLINLVKSKIDFSGKKSWKSLQRIAEALGPLYNAHNLANGFMDIITWFKDQNNVLSRKFAIFLLEVLSNIGAITEDKLDEGAINNFKEIFTKGLDDTDIDVKVCTLGSATQFLANILNEGTLLKFSCLGDKMLLALVATLKYENENKNSNDSKGKTALETMNEIVDQHPKFWKGKTEDIINIVNEISKGKIFPNQIRECALELVYSLCKNSPSIIKKSTNFKKLFLPLLFSLLLEVDNENDINTWEKHVDEDENDADEMFYAVRDGFERLALDLGDDYFTSATADYLKKFLSSQNWIEQHAAFNVLAYMCEGCKKSFTKNLKEVLQFISTGLTNSHPRVRFAALFAFGLLLKTTAPKPQKEFTNNILPALAQLMGDKEKSLRVKTQSCNSLVEFLRGLLNEEISADEAQKIISNYTNDLVKLTSQLFEYSLSVSYSPLQEASLSAISILSNLLEKNFAPYYNQLMPGLKKLFYNLNAQTEEQKKLKSNTIETMGFLCSSIAEDSAKYENDLQEISNAFLNYMPTLKEEDPQLSTIIHSFTHLSLAMKEKFLPYLEKLLPMLQNYVKADIGLKIEDAALTEYIPEDKDEKVVGSVEFNLGSNTTKLSLHTFALQNKILGFTVLNEIALNMGHSFYKYIEILLNLSKDLLEFPFNRKIRKIAVKNLEAALNACANDADKKKVLDFMGEPVLKSLNHAIEKKFIKDIKGTLKALTLAFNLINDKTNFSEKFIGELYECLSKTCKLIDVLKNDIINSVVAKKIEEDEEGEILTEFDGLNEIERKVMEVSGILFKLFGTPITALVAQKLYDSFLNNWNSNLKRNQLKSDQEILSAVCFFDDFIEYGDPAAANMFVPSFIDNTFEFQTENEDILQSVVYGYGVIAKKLNKEEFKPYNQKVISYIAKIMQRPVNEDNGRTYDNAISSMGKYVIYQCAVDANSLNMGKQFIKLLPLKNDLDEGKAVCEEFFTQLKNGNQLLVNNDNMGEIKQTLSEIKALNDDKKFLDDQETVLNELMSKF